jgi:hypothetical protein
VIVTPVTGLGAVQVTTAVLLFVHACKATLVGAFGVAADAGSAVRKENANTLVTEITVMRRRKEISLTIPFRFRIDPPISLSTELQESFVSGAYMGVNY